MYKQAKNRTQANYDSKYANAQIFYCYNLSVELKNASRSVLKSTHKTSLKLKKLE